MQSTITFPEVESFSFFRDLLNDPIMILFRKLAKDYQSQPGNTVLIQDDYFKLKAALLAYSFDKSEAYQYAKTPWKDWIVAAVIGDDNPLGRLFERGIIQKNHPFRGSMLADFQILTRLYHFDWQTFLASTDLDENDIFDAVIFFPIPPHDTIARAFEAKDIDVIFTAVNHYVHDYGLGIFENNICFKIDDTGVLVPIPARIYKSMDDLVGVERQKKELIQNTQSFIDHYTGLNVLLQGDMGTGKSTMIKALLETFKGTKLRMIEFKKDQIGAIPGVIATIKDRPYPFILFVDDLSFDDKEDDFKLFKNILEGSLEDNPQNVLIYATSNKRHLITETMSERTDAIHQRDVIEEKLSLSSRFGLVIPFTAPNQKEYLSIVHQMAAIAGINIDSKDLDRKAIQWELRHLNRSGRTAEQFINYLLIHKN